MQGDSSVIVIINIFISLFIHFVNLKVLCREGKWLVGVVNMASQGEVGRGEAAGRSESAVKELFSSLEELHNDLKSKGEEE